MRRLDGAVGLHRNEMPFVKLDCEILKSSLWYERLQRELFITSLLMARA
jgi:hypothetical protein